MGTNFPATRPDSGMKFVTRGSGSGGAKIFDGGVVGDARRNSAAGVASAAAAGTGDDFGVMVQLVAGMRRVSEEGRICQRINSVMATAQANTRPQAIFCASTLPTRKRRRP